MYCHLFLWFTVYNDFIRLFALNAFLDMVSIRVLKANSAEFLMLILMISLNLLPRLNFHEQQSSLPYTRQLIMHTRH